MRYRVLSPTGDYVYGAGPQAFLVDSPACVGQAILTALLFFTGQWYLDLSQGVPWLTSVVGKNPPAVYDQIIQQAIVNVQGVSSITAYNSTLNAATRTLTVTVMVETIYTSASGSTSTTVTVPMGFGLTPFGLAPFGN